MDKGSAQRFNKGKIRYDLIPVYSQKQYAMVLTKGAEKYGDRNWQKGMSWMSVVSSLERHLQAFKQGEDFDSETGLLHTAHIMCNASFLSEYYKIYPEGDDRFHSYMQSRKIALDIDGVLADFQSDFRKRYNLTDNNEHWTFSYLTSNPAIWEELAKDDKFWMDLKPLMNGNDIPFDVTCYVTHRPVSKEVSEKWLELHNFPCAPVYCAKGSKVDILKSQEIDIFVDDNVSNFIECNKAGICCFLMDRKWNKYVDVGFKRITNLNDII